jgi:hypothetical protein
MDDTVTEPWTCGSCRFWARWREDFQPRDRKLPRVGDCWRFPPVAVVEGTATGVHTTWGRPIVGAASGCGEWQPRAPAADG